MARDNKNEEHRGDMSVSEAGHKGGEKVRRLVEEGKKAESSGGEGEENRSDEDESY